ncbi:MAG: hypothetical protein AAF669_02780 [Pseudomonadota bacterium]
MTKINKIQMDIESLPHNEFIKLLHWIYEKDMSEWDMKLAKDSKDGKLDFLIDEVSEEEKSRTLWQL